MPKHYTQRSLSSFIFPIVLAAVISIITIIIGIGIGSTTIPFSTILGSIVTFISRDPIENDSVFNIIWLIRAPRIILAFIVGAALAMCGAAFQGLLKNPLADPYTLGTSSGGALGAVLVIFLGIELPLIGKFTLPFVSMLFSLSSILLLLLLVKGFGGVNKLELLILAGVVFSSFIGATISLIIAISGQELRQVISWLLGSVSMRGWESISLALPFIIIGFIIISLYAYELNAFSLGEEHAHNLGVNVTKSKLIILIAASITTGAAVAVSGTIGFVGLIVPHLLRAIYGGNYIKLIPLSFLYGGTFLVIADIISRKIIQPIELPIGVITALIGAPFFAVIIYISVRRRRNSA
ncbi:MAG: ABC-type cobalamin/Fe3+-siderophore transport system, permease component [Bacillales bacterium]|nr:ABC-type cobalamin/Fe3+-siderophore transport system, permease component [Bacillales bacterium]